MILFSLSKNHNKEFIFSVPCLILSLIMKKVPVEHVL